MGTVRNSDPVMVVVRKLLPVAGHIRPVRCRSQQTVKAIGFGAQPDALHARQELVRPHFRCHMLPCLGPLPQMGKYCRQPIWNWNRRGSELRLTIIGRARAQVRRSFGESVAPVADGLPRFFSRVEYVSASLPSVSDVE